MRRRDLLTVAAGLALSGDTWGMGRIPIGGTLALRVPWSTGSLDPHDLFDPLAALFGHAVADPVYVLDNQGRPYATLADGLPKIEGEQTVVTLRAGLRSAKGKALGGRDLAWSIKRARSLGAVGLLANLTPFVRSDPARPLIARFGQVDPVKLAAMLASPLVALLPVGFSPSDPDGTGAFTARCSPRALELVRNPYAARGPAFLERVTIASAPDLASSLRAFESGKDDVGWLGTGLHGTRSGARPFDYGEVGWVVLVTGRQAGAFGAPGAAQQLANAVPVERLALGLGPRPDVRAGTLWSGDPTALYYDGGSGQLRRIAEAVAAKLSQSGHEVTPGPVDRARLRRLRSRGDYALALDVVRDPLGVAIGPTIALATADRVALGRATGQHPPRIPAGRAPNHLTTSLRVGVLGGLAARGGVAPGVTLGVGRAARGFELGRSYRST